MTAESPDNNFFDTEYLKADLKGRSIRGGAVTISAQALKFFLNMASTMILARLLTPGDFGLIAMVTAITGFVRLFRDMGLSMATVQKAEINHHQISTLFWINVMLSICIMAVTMALAPVIAWFYRDPRLAWITLTLASGYIFSGLTIQHQALLRRQMRFSVLAYIQIISMLAGIITAIVAALYGASYWALVLMHIGTAVANAIGVWVACNWRPGWPRFRTGVREMLKFGGNLTGFNSVNYFARHLDNILIGRFCGASVLGIYQKAYSLLLLPIQQVNSPISSIAIPALSRLQNEPNKFRSFYKKGVFLVAFITMPLILFLFIAADSVILLVLGNQWLGAVTIFRILVPAAFIGSFNIATGWVYLSLGQTDRQLRMGVICSLVTVLGFAIGVHWNAIGVASAFSIVNCIMLYPRVSYCYKQSPLKVHDLLEILWEPALASLTACMLVLVVEELLQFNFSVIVMFAVKFVFFTIFYILFWYFIPRGRQRLREILETIRYLRPVTN